MHFFHIDSFTDTAFNGNPAGVCISKYPLNNKFMQNFASEINLSETAFIWSTAKGFYIKWFSPLIEIPLCGHATLAAAFALFKSGMVALDDQIVFQSKSGILYARKSSNEIELDFPLDSLTPCQSPLKIIDTLKLKSYTSAFYSHNTKNILIHLDSAEELLTLQPNFQELKKIHLMDATSLTLTSKSDNREYDFISRCFAPWEGINEDHVTGSTHTFLAPFWRAKLGKEKFTAYQASKRGGILQLKIVGQRLLISGKAFILMAGSVSEEIEGKIIP